MVRGNTWAELARIPDQPEASINWEQEYPEVYALASSKDFSDYLRRFADIDTRVFEDDRDVSL